MLYHRADWYIWLWSISQNKCDGFHIEHYKLLVDSFQAYGTMLEVHYYIDQVLSYW